MEIMSLLALPKQCNVTADKRYIGTYDSHSRREGREGQGRRTILTLLDTQTRRNHTMVSGDVR